MKFLKFLEILLFLISLTLICSQILIPALMHEPLFPWFRRKTRLEKDFVDVEAEIALQQKEEELAALKKTLTKKKEATPAEKPSEPPLEKPKKVRKQAVKTTKNKTV